MIFYKEPVSITDLPNKCIVIFTQQNCEACSKLIKKLEDVNFEFHILNEVSGSLLGPEFSILSAPTGIIIDSGVEKDRFYGNKTIEYFERIIKDNF